MVTGRRLEPVGIKDVQLRDSFLASRQRLVREIVLPYQWEALNDRVPDVPESGAIRNFRIAAGEVEGPFTGRVFQDSDVAKWLEAVSYILAAYPDEELEKTADEVIDLIVRAQQPDGYLNTYYTITGLDHRWTNTRDDHELYCAGHMIEAAVAYYQATGKRKLLDAMSCFADHIAQVFGPNQGQKPGYPGHPELELALYKLYRATGEKRYLDLAKFFVDQRGQEPNWFLEEAKARGELEPTGFRKDLRYFQAHAPVREQVTAEGHSVRALYLFAGVADVAIETGDEELFEVCKAFWRNVTRRRMYVTAGVGSQAFGERFTIDYDLPSERAYAETCASIALVFFAHRMLQAEVAGEYADVMELALYNGIPSGISLDGRKFFYVNPLEVWPEAARERYDLRHIETERSGWFDCACCPPNLARLFASIGSYMYSQDAGGIYVHLYSASEAKFEVKGQTVKLIQETDYPWNGEIRIRVEPQSEVAFTLALRIPGWCAAPHLAVNGEDQPLGDLNQQGYAYLNRVWRPGDRVELTLPMPVERVVSHPRVRDNAGRVALRRGPIVYCLEEVDNGPNLRALRLPRDANLEAVWDPDLLGGVVKIVGQGYRIDENGWDGALYRNASQVSEKQDPVDIVAIPYALWCNRTPGEMLVWIHEDR